jgi:hypothetical protein
MSVRLGQGRAICDVDNLNFDIISFDISDLDKVI